MEAGALLVLTAGMAAALFGLSFMRARRQSMALECRRHLDSLPLHYAMHAALWCGIPALVFLLLWQVFVDRALVALLLAELPENIRAMPGAQRELLVNSVRNIAAGITDGGTPAQLYAAQRLSALEQGAVHLRSLTLLCLLLAGAAWGWIRIRPAYSARRALERATEHFLLASACVAVLATVGIVLSVLFEALRFFSVVPLHEFLFGLHWSPQLAIRADQVGASGAFGAVPLFVGTFLISAVAMGIAIPVGMMSAIYLSEYASRRLRAVAKPTLEVLAGIPTVVYGFFAALTIAPLVRDIGLALGLSVSSESALAAGLVMGIMTIPFVSSLSDDVINAVPQALRDGALALGATPSEVTRQVVLPAALPGIVGSILLAVSRAIGETMVVVMAAGLAANLTLNPLESVTTITVQIVTLLVGDQEFSSPRTLAAFALGLVLFAVTLLFNIIALAVVRRYREKYE